MPRDAPGSAEIARRMTLKQGPLAALLALAMIDVLDVRGTVGVVRSSGAGFLRGFDLPRALPQLDRKAHFAMDAVLFV